MEGVKKKTFAFRKKDRNRVCGRKQIIQLHLMVTKPNDITSPSHQEGGQPQEVKV